MQTIMIVEDDPDIRDGVRFEYVRVYHTATEDFHPTGMLAERATFTTADVTTDIHFSTGFCKGEV